MKKTLILAAIYLSLTGCTRIETGAVGVLKHWGGEISTEPQTGFVTTILDSIIGHIDTTETRALINNLQPSDANGVLLDDLDLVVSFTLYPNKVPTFYIQTKELDTYKDDSGREVTTVGLKVLENIIKHTAQEVTKKQSLVTLAAALTDYEHEILVQAQKELDAGYPGVFKLLRVNVNHFIPPASIREQANRTAALKSEAERNTEEQKLIAQRRTLEASKALVEAQALAEAVASTGLKAEQLIAWRQAKAAELQAKAFGERAQPVVAAPQGSKP
jgi:hypothetical protein